jgi:hypothetical protein
MINAELLIETTEKKHRQEHLDLTESCIERGGNSTNHKGVLAQYLNTTIPYGRKYLLCHACNNEKCSNPKHLYWGSPKENVEDAIKNGHFGMLGRGGYKKIMSEETKQKISATLKGRPSNNKTGVNGGGLKGFTYSRKYKQIWINDGINQTRVKFDSEIPDGYVRGRLR